MALNTDDRVRVWRALLRINVSAPNVLKSDLQAAVNATDAWIDENQSSYNAALPATFRNNASLSQKTLMFCAVALARVSIQHLQRVFGEVD